MSRAAIGSSTWAARTDGALGRREALSLARQAVSAQLRGVPGWMRAWLFDGDRGSGSALVSGRDAPDSKLAREAYELARESARPALLGHCVRCWLWADLFAQRDAIAYDAELLYIACLLHDLALTDAHLPDQAARCFAVHGGEVARATLEGRGAEPAFAQRVSEAIVLHMNIEVSHSEGAEAHLLHAAAHLDAGGTRAGDLPRRVRREVLEAQPRNDFADEFGQLMCREAGERPRSRAALLWRLGSRFPISHNPLDRT